MSIFDDQYGEDMDEECFSYRILLIQLSKAYKDFSIRGRASSAYMSEISKCIEFGMLIAASQMSLTLIEIWVRDLLVVNYVKNKKYKTKDELIRKMNEIDISIEEDGRNYSFRRIINLLRESGIISNAELCTLSELYESFRIPLHHGITGRLLKNTNDFGSFFASNPHSRFKKFDDFMHENSLRIIAEVLGFIVNHQIPYIDHEHIARIGLRRQVVIKECQKT